ncbi:MAG: dicarboxylate/amino acid:cation symporter [Treponema sp.]|jgi:Na+/H+-dicarboxylate symporter|nr:dicarboxylate/amino acid:cation symporter [Treponema sp.]
MKIWVKLIIGAVFGLILGFILPENNPSVLRVLTFFKDLSIGMGRYTALPIIVFSLTIGIYELRQDNKFWRVLIRSFLTIAGISLFLISLGIGVTLLFSPARIPVLIEHQSEEIFFSPAQNLLDIFPSNMFTVLFSGGIYIFPMCIFAFFLALGLCYDRNYTKQVISLIDALSRIFFHIATFFSEILGLIIISLAAFWAVQYKDAFNSGVFVSIIRMLLIFCVILAFVILPSLLFFIKRIKNPWKVLYGCLGPAIAAFFSGDYNFTIPVLMMHLKENLRVRRRSSSITLALFSTFGRSGSAMVACVAFIVIIKSYSSLSIPGHDLIYIGFTAFCLSFMLARNSSDAAFTALALLCARYGHGFETGYLILKPIAFYLISIGAFIDIIITALGSFAIAHLNNIQDDKSLTRFI